MKLTATNIRRIGSGEFKANVSLLNDDGTTLYEDCINLSKRSSRDKLTNDLCDKFPELKGKDLDSQLLLLLWGAKEDAKGNEVDRGEKSQAKKLVKMAEDKAVTFFHTPSKAAFASIAVDGHFEIYNTRSKAFKQWLSRQLYVTEEIVPNSDSLNSAINSIEGKAIYEGETHELYNRVAYLDKKIYYDLTDSAWSAVEISETGWAIIEQPPILFFRYQHQKQQIEPIHSGDILKVLNFVNLEKGSQPEDNQQLLFLAYLVAAFIPDIPHPIIHPYGHQGATKTTLMRVIKKLVDPSLEELLICPKDVNELAQKLSHHWVCFFDNLSTIPDWFSDMLCRVSTGASFAKRELFTDDSDIIFQLKRVAGINGINIVTTKADLLDRSIPLELTRIPDNKRREEKELWGEFEKDAPQILGGIFNTLSKAMAIYPNLKLDSLPRMADFAKWGAAISVALGYSAEEFIKAYQENIKSQNTELLTSNPVSQTILKLMEGREYWDGTPSVLLSELSQIAEELQIKTNSTMWPKAPQILTRRLNEIVPNLQKDGYEVKTTKKSDERKIHITKILQQPLPIDGENIVSTVIPSQLASKSNDDTDDDTDNRKQDIVQNSPAFEQNSQIPSPIVRNTVIPKQSQKRRYDDGDGISVTSWKKGSNNNSSEFQNNRRKPGCTKSLNECPDYKLVNGTFSCQCKKV